MDKSDSFDENFSSSSDNNSNKLEDKIKEINNPFKYNNINRKNQKRATRVNSNTNLNLDKEDPSSRRNTGVDMVSISMNNKISNSIKINSKFNSELKDSPNTNSKINFSNSILMKENNKKSELKEKKNIKNYIYFKGEKMKLVSNPFEFLNECNHVIVEQKLDLLEILSGCENSNKYHVYTSELLNEKKYLFKCSEISSCFCRNFCPSNTKSYSLLFQYPLRYNLKTKKTIAIFKKKFNCSKIFCCNKNEMIGLLTEREDIYLNVGKIIEKKNGCNCNPFFVVNNEKGKIKYLITTEYCQTGFCCRGNSLGKCYEVDFFIYDAKIKINKNTRPIGIIHKYYQGLSELVGDADAYLINFPSQATAYEKLLLIAGTIFIDYNYYENVAWCDCNCV
jgi:hypothetical protein